MILLLCILLTIGGFAGVLAGLLGVGGGIILVPAFFYAFNALGYDGPGIVQLCLATSLATIVVTSARSLQGHHRKGAVDMQVLLTWSHPIAVGAVIGVLTAAQLSSAILLLIFATLASGIGLYMTLGKAAWTVATDLPTGRGRAPVAAVLGWLSVLLGIGGGSLGVPLMTLCGRPIHQAVATASGFGLAIAVPSTLGWLLVTPEGILPPFTLGSVNLIAFGIIVPMTFLTAPLGVRLAHALDPKPLKRIFGVFLVLVALNMGWEAL